ncbi:MAG: cell division protein ZipA [Marinobacter sp.]|uniref:cell division protein ZipA n=1 Tax=Marinobacter sp. TaxID=50741 RepID=UPI0034A04F9D
MSLREWLIAIGTLVILAIVIDGLRRMRRARKDAVEISAGMGADELEESPLEKEFNPELPNGGARPITRDTLQERGYLKSHGKTRFANPEPKPTRPVVSSKPGAKTEKPSVEPDAYDVDDAETDQAVYAPEGDAYESPHEAENTESGWGAIDDEPDIDDGILGEARAAGDERQATETTSDADEPADPVDATPPVVTSEVEEDTARRTTRAQSDQPLAGANRPEAQEVVVINVLSKPSQAFSGPDLKKLFEACGLEHGDLDIYHRHEESDTYSPVQFSVANAVEPGTFRPDEIAGISTPGISFFMSLPGPNNAMQAFDFMLGTAQCVVRNLGGELKDERRSVMTPQTIEHCRQRIREYERKHHAQRV